MQTIDFDKLKLSQGDRLLDVGCGEGRHTIGAYLAADIEAIGVDLSDKDIATAKEKAKAFVDPGNKNNRIEFKTANALKLPFEDNYFDKVVCSEVLEHIPDFKGVLAEINRVLKPDGVLAVSVPRAWPEEICWRLSQAYHEVEGGHIRIFNDVHLRREVESLGLKRYARHWAHALHVPYWWLKCALWGKDEQSKLVQGYHKFLVWDMIKKPKSSRFLERALDPVMGKSVVMYFERV